MSKVSINNLGSFAERINRQPQPTDKFSVTMTRAEIEYISNFVKHRVKACNQALIDPQIKESTHRQRAKEASVVEALQTHLQEAKIL